MKTVPMDAASETHYSSPPDYDSGTKSMSMTSSSDLDPLPRSFVNRPGDDMTFSPTIPVNNVYVNRALGSISCKYTIDPTLKIIHTPRAGSSMGLLSHLQYPGASRVNMRSGSLLRRRSTLQDVDRDAKVTENNRQSYPPMSSTLDSILGSGEISNVKLHTKMGTIDADLTLVSGKEGEEVDNSITRRRSYHAQLESAAVRIDIENKVGSIDVILRTSSFSRATRPTIHLTAATHTGTISVLLPRSFHGFLVVHTKVGHLSLDPELDATSAVLSANMTSSRVWIGDSRLLKEFCSSWERWDAGDAVLGSSARGYEGQGMHGWQGDEVVLRTKVGAIFVGYVKD